MTIIQGAVMTQDLGPLLKGVEISFAKKFDDTLKMVLPQYTRIFDVIEGSGNQMTMKNLSGISRLTKVGELQKGKEVDKYDGLQTTFKFNTYKGVYTISRQSIEDLEFSNDLREAANLATAAKMAPEYNCSGVFNTAFTNAVTYNDGTTTYDLYKPTGDVNPLLSSSHPLANGGTGSNVLTDSAPLTPDSLAKLKTLIRQTKTEAGEPMNFNKGYILVVPPALEDVAIRITQSAQIQGSNNNDINTNRNVEVLVWDFLESSTAYFLLSKDNMGLIASVRVSPDLKQKIDDLTSSIENIVYTRFGAGYRDWRGIAGSRGDSVAYAG